MSKKDKFVEKPWKEIQKLVIVPADDEDVCVYQDGMVMDDDGNIIGQIRGWNRSDPARLKRLSANIVEEDEDEEAGPIDVAFETRKISKLPEFEPKRVLRLPAPEAPKPVPAPAPTPEPEKSVQKSAPETPAPAPEPQARTRRARAGGFRLGPDGTWQK